jgi:type I restriction enzyme S subunit
MSKIDELIAQYCPNGVEFKKLKDIFKISRGRVMSKEYLSQNRGEYPVYSSQTANNGQIGKISTYDYDGEYLTWTTDGANAGTIFYRNEKFSITNVCGLLVPEWATQNL